MGGPTCRCTGPGPAGSVSVHSELCGGWSRRLTMFVGHNMINTAFNFTPRAKRLLALAQAQAVRFKHNSVATEHLLLGLLELKEGVAANVLRKMDIDLDTVRLAVERQIHSNSIQKGIGNIPYSSSSKKVLSLAEEERKNLKHSYLA